MKITQIRLHCGVKSFLIRIYYTLRTFRNHASMLSVRADVENTLWQVALGKRGPLTSEECQKLALKLGVPQWVGSRKAKTKNQPNSK